MSSCSYLTLDRCSGCDVRGSGPRVLSPCRLCFYSTVRFFHCLHVWLALGKPVKQSLVSFLWKEILTLVQQVSVFRHLLLSGSCSTDVAPRSSLLRWRLLFLLRLRHLHPQGLRRQPLAWGGTKLGQPNSQQRPWQNLGKTLNPPTPQNCFIKIHFLPADSWLWHPGFKPLKR